MTNQIQKITITSGTPRKNSTYMVAGTRIQAARAIRARPMKIPRTNPRMMAGMASRRVPPMNGPMPISPCTMRNVKLFVMTARSTAQPAFTREISPGIA